MHKDYFFVKYLVPVQSESQRRRVFRGAFPDEFHGVIAVILFYKVYDNAAINN